MLTDQHPITPPPELLEQWATEYWGPGESMGEGEKYIATQAARWGADQELEACVEWLPSDLTINGESLRAARRPNPPSLVEEALLAIDAAVADNRISAEIARVTRTALERLQELEEGND